MEPMQELDLGDATPRTYGQVAREALSALTRLDAESLESLATACRAFKWEPRSPEGCAARAREISETAGEMDLLARLLEMTRTSILVMLRSTENLDGCSGYGPGSELDRQNTAR